MNTTLHIAAATFVVCIFMSYCAYQLAGGLMYRNPGWLFGTGCVVAALGVVTKALPLLAQEGWVGPGAKGLDIAAAAVDPTLMALASGLIGAAFVLNVQWQYEHERENLLETLKMVEDNLQEELRRGSMGEEYRDSWHESIALRTKHLRQLRKRLKRLNGGQKVNTDSSQNVSVNIPACRCNHDRSQWSD
ncbi:hypothetical protein HUX88_29120 [Duganella sp. BJB1802]|uniref:hypothetical protein n=1 Tax=unclassified Duganella TaxID=2636909 RepID=UPI0011C1C21A|nr:MULTISPECIES: hypothetical protein [unclassified Duganella]NVD74550.1 hypothetical protein [Duganella sp. BJB1802]